MAKNGPNDLIFGKLVISNDFERPIEPFLKILIFGKFRCFFGPKTAILAPNGPLWSHFHTTGQGGIKCAN